MKKHFIVPTITASLIVLFGTIAGSVYAHGFGMFEDGQTSLIKKIAQRFGLSESDVKSVFVEFKEEKQQQMQTQFESQLTSAVNNGTVTEEQKQAIIDRHNQMIENKQEGWQSLKDLTPEERILERQKIREEHEAWANQNGLSLETLQEIMGGRDKFHMRFAH